MSKGSTPRPQQVSNAEFDERWELIFGDQMTFETGTKRCLICGKPEHEDGICEGLLEQQANR